MKKSRSRFKKKRRKLHFDLFYKRVEGEAAKGKNAVGRELLLQFPSFSLPLTSSWLTSFGTARGSDKGNREFPLASFFSTPLTFLRSLMATFEVLVLDEYFFFPATTR